MKNSYSDVETVEETSNIEGATKVSKAKKKVDLGSMFGTESLAAENEDPEPIYEFAKVTYTSNRKYYVKIKIVTSGNSDPVGTIYSKGGTTEDDETNSNLLLTKVNGNKQGYYGKKVSGYTANGISDWRIFYSDTNNVFLITTDYVKNTPISNIPNDLVSTGKLVPGSGLYNTMFPNASAIQNPSFSYNYLPYVMDETLDIKDIPWFDVYSSAHPDSSYTQKYNATCAHILFNRSFWSNFANTDMALDAIATPTINMYVASWNTVYPNMKIYCNKIGGTINQTTGYRIGTSSEPDENNWSIGSYPEGSKTYSEFIDGNNMYYPHKDTVNSCSGYWLASPSAYDAYSLLTIGCNGNIYGSAANSSNFALRPVVRLKSDLITNSTLDDDVIIIENPES